MIGSTFFGNTLVAPRWAADFLNREHLEPWAALLDVSQFTDQLGVPITVTASAAQNATSITIAALQPSLYPATSIIASGNTLIKNGSTIYFGSAKFAVLTADAHVGDTTLTVAALPTALTGSETATYSAYNTISVPSGTLVGRTLAERDNGVSWGPAAATDDEIFLTAFDLVDIRTDNTASLYRHTSRVKENYLPQYAALQTAADDVQTATISGTPTGGTFTLSLQLGTGATQTTSAIAYNATGATVQTALQALSNVGANNVTVTGSAGGPYVITFVGNLAGSPMPVLTQAGSFTGGSSPAIAVVHTTTGGGTSTILGKIRSLYQCILGVD